MRELFERLFGAKTYDLRWFQVIQWSESWDGRSVVSDGWTHRTILYMGEMVYQRSNYRDYGQRELTRETGDPKFLGLYALSCAYLDFGHKARQLLGIDQKDKAFSSEVIMSEATREALIVHPQFIEALAAFGGRVKLVTVNDRSQVALVSSEKEV